MTLYDEVRAMVRETEFRPRKSRGQNFLIHERVIDSILRLLDLRANEAVVEIGPGLGFVTRRLIEHAGYVWAVEIDAALVERLKHSAWVDDAKLELIHGDILTLDLSAKLPLRKIKLVGNLPYSISTPVLFRVLQWREHFSTLVLMVQKEVAERIAAVPGTKDYGTLSVWCQVYGRIADKVHVAPEAFYPKPKVRSTILRIDLYDRPLITSEDQTVLRGAVRAAFGQRRKTLTNNLTAWLQRDRSAVDELLNSCHIDGRRRGESLTVDEFIELARCLRLSNWAPAVP